MAISEIEYRLVRALRENNVLPLAGEVLELGEANWYGDVGVGDLQADIERFAREDEQGLLRTQLDAMVAANRPTVLFEIARVFWQTFLQPKAMTAIDYDGASDKTLKLDLNEAIDLGRRFDLVMNLGTLEHVFNIAQGFKTIHDHTAPGGLMIHGLPFSGWVDHGFYSFNPTFFWDLAAANGYEVVTMILTAVNPFRMARLKTREDAFTPAAAEIGPNALIYAVFRRPAAVAAFRVPTQGYYDRAISEEAVEAWHTKR
jgi:SAM-dependent methyltransferase